jgi:AcrR family transcriptional regulator
MGLLEEHKNERKARILAAARRLIAEAGFDGLNMRALAEASRVSVPTLYNLFGSKHAILAAEMEATFAEVARAPRAVDPRDFVARTLARLDAGIDSLLAVPGYSRELVRVMLATRETDGLRQAIEERYIAMMAANLAAARADGELAGWVDPGVLARHLFFDFITALLGWASGALDDAGLRATAYYGMCMLVGGVAQGAAADELRRRAQKAQRHLKRR